MKDRDKKAELCKAYREAIDDFRKFFEYKKNLMKAKQKRISEAKTEET